MNIIGDIAANYKTFMALLKKMPDEEVISLGDLVDRGPRAKETIEWFMKHGKALLGNHEHMMIDAWLSSKNPDTYQRYYRPQLWIIVNDQYDNGGLETLKSYDPNFNPSQLIHEVVPEAHIEFLKSLPLFLEFEGLFLSHAPKAKKRSPQECAFLGKGFYNNLRTEREDASLIWNRRNPAPYENKLQIFGHNSFTEVRYFSPHFRDGIGRNPDDQIYAMGIDTSGAQILTGIHYPSLTVYQQEYID